MGEDERQTKQANNFMNDQNQPSPELLAQLRDEASVESRDKLREIADDYNVSYDPDTSHQELYDRISLAMEQQVDNQ